MRMIFHVPFKMNDASAFANDIRPVKMLEAFRAIGYEVDVVHGNNVERKSRAREVRRKLRSGVTYEFVYSESSTLPTALTDPSKRPTHPFFDLLFLRHCRNNGLKVGLFYRDVYWRFANTGQYRSGFRRRTLTAFHLLDLAVYNFSVSRIYLPSMGMRKFVPLVTKIDMSALPPGHDVSEALEIRDPSRPLRLLYVGGLGENYDLRRFMAVVREISGIQFTLCTRPMDWERERAKYSELLGDNIAIVHEAGAGLTTLYREADVGVFFTRPSPYLKFAVPVKLFEYIGHLLPVIAVKDTTTGSIVDDLHVGWAIPFESEALEALLDTLAHQPEVIADLKVPLKQSSIDNTWQARAATVADDLRARG